MLEESRVPWVKAAVAAGRPYSARLKKPWVHNTVNLSATAALLAVGVALMACSRSASPWLYVPLAALGFGWVYFGLFVLVVHEASHNMFVLLHDRNLQRTINRVGGWLIAGMFATHYGKHWERGHLEHHVRPMEPDDPQRSVMTGRRLFGLIAGYLLVPGFLPFERTVLRKRRAGKSSGSKLVIVGFLAFWTVVLTLATQLGGWPLALALYFGIPLVAIMNLLKSSLEHGGSIAEEPNPFLRSRTTLIPLRRLVLPFNISLHFEHHLNHQVPWYDLVRYQRDLRRIVPAEVQSRVFNSDLWSQLSGRLGGMSPAARAARDAATS